jgi:hypothetical protein
MSDYDPVERSTDLDGHGLAPAVEPDRPSIAAKMTGWPGHP